MQIDDNSLRLAERKRARLTKLDYSEATLHEIVSFVAWAWSQPTLRFYMKAIVEDGERARTDIVMRLHAVTSELIELAKEIMAAPEEIKRGEDPKRAGSLQSIVEETERLLLDDDVSSQLHNTREIAGRFRAKANEISSAAANTDADEGAPESSKIFPLTIRMVELSRVMQHIAKHETSIASSSGFHALGELVNAARDLNPPIEGAIDWTQFYPDHDPARAEFQGEQHFPNIGSVVPTMQRHLDRFVEELHAKGSTSLSYRSLIARFKERCVHYDKSHMRNIAKEQQSDFTIGREDRLTLELAKYLHDAGVFVLARARVGNLEPDLVGLSGLAVEAKAYSSSGSARSDIIGAYAQLHGYMVQLDGGTIYATEGFVVTFRLDEPPIYSLPETVIIGRFVIHSFMIDLGTSPTSGSNARKPIVITEEEIVAALTAEPSAAPTTSGAVPQETE